MIASRVLSTPVLEAASISTTSMASPRAMPRHDSHLSQGFVTGLSLLWQFRHLARMRAVLVLPVPRVPQKRYACAMRPDSMARFGVSASFSLAADTLAARRPAGSLAAAA